MRPRGLNHHILEFLDHPRSRPELVRHLKAQGQIGRGDHEINRMDRNISELIRRRLIARQGRIIQATPTAKHVIAGLEDGLLRGETLTLALLSLADQPISMRDRARRLGIHHTRSFYHEHLSSLIKMDLVMRYEKEGRIHYRATEWGLEAQRRVLTLYGWKEGRPPRGWVYLNNTSARREPEQPVVIKQAAD